MQSHLGLWKISWKDFKQLWRWLMPIFCDVLKTVMRRNAVCIEKEKRPLRTHKHVAPMISGGVRFDIGRNTVCPEEGFTWFSLIPPEKCWDLILLDHGCFLSNTFKFFIHHSLYHSTLYNLIYAYNKQLLIVILKFYCRYFY
jgi:hypothetical protein